MTRQRLAGDRAFALHNVEKTGRHAGLDRKFGEPQYGIGRQLGRLEHHGIARGERRADLPGCHDQRVVPRRDGADHAVGFGDHHAEAILLRGRDLTAELVGVFGKKPQSFGSERHVPRGGVAQRPRRAYRFEWREPRAVGFDEVGPASQHACTFARRATRPAAALPCRVRVAHRGVDGCGVCERQARVRLAIGRPVDREAFVARNQAAADEVAAWYLNPIGFEAAHREIARSWKCRKC